MDLRRLVAICAALMLAVTLVSPGTASPGIGVGVMQLSPGSEDGQPTAEHNTMYVFGNAPLSSCWSKFNNTDGDSANYGEKSQGGTATMDVKVTCRMDPVLQDDVRLAESEMIQFRFSVFLGGTWENGQGSCNGDCENLNISLLKGNREVAVKEFDALSDEDNQIVWDLPVTEDLVPWNGSQESLAVEFRMVIKSSTGAAFWNPDDEAIFGLYFTHPDNPPERNATVTFPILNESAVEELEGGGKDKDEQTPGFTAMIGVGGLAAAALLRPKKSEEDE